MTIDVPNAFIQTHMPLPKDGERVVMKVKGRLVDWFIELDPTSYASKAVYEGKSRVIYLEVLRAIYGMLVARLLWYRKITSDLESEEFEFNPYDACIANRTYLKVQQTIRLHVDEMLVSSEKKESK